jgi:hypothetical protein
LTYLLNYHICATVGRTANLPIRAIGNLLRTNCSRGRIGDRRGWKKQDIVKQEQALHPTNLFTKKNTCSPHSLYPRAKNVDSSHVRGELCVYQE